MIPSISPADQSALLRSIVERCSREPDAPTSVIVFDLDGTLMDNRPRTVRILHELGDLWKTREPDASKLLNAARADDLQYLLTDSLTKLGVTRTELVAQAEVFWRERFFTDEYLAHDVALAGASEFARACYSAGGVLVYFTGRDLPLMGVGSFASLRDLGFPIGVPGTELVLKPDAQMPDEAFKRLYAPELTRVGSVIAAFDNEPANCNLLHERFPKAETVLVDTQHLPGAPNLLPAVKVVKDFMT